MTPRRSESSPTSSTTLDSHRWTLDRLQTGTPHPVRLPIDTVAMKPGEARQRLAELEVIVAAHERGYYDTPNENTLLELATELEMTENEISEHLSQSTRQLVEQYLEPS